MGYSLHIHWWIPSMKTSHERWEWVVGFSQNFCLFTPKFGEDGFPFWVEHIFDQMAWWFNHQLEIDGAFFFQVARLGCKDRRSIFSQLRKKKNPRGESPEPSVPESCGHSLGGRKHVRWEKCFVACGGKNERKLFWWFCDLCWWYFAFTFTLLHHIRWFMFEIKVSFEPSS